MLFREGLLTPELVANPRARVVLTRVADLAPEPIHPGDFLAAALSLRDHVTMAAVVAST